MTQIKFADFEEGSDGNSVNTGFQSYNGTVNYESTGALKGSLSANIPSGTTAISNLQWSSMTPIPAGWIGGYFEAPAAPDASPWIITLISARTTGSTQFKVDINTSGEIVLKDAGTIVRGTSTFTCDGSTPVRLTVGWDNPSNTILVNLYYGANIDGATPDEVLGGGASSYTGGDIDRCNIGLGSAQSSGIPSNLLMDNLTVDDADEPLLPTGVDGVATYDLSYTFTTDEDDFGNASYVVDATGSTGTVTLVQQSGTTAAPSESSGVFTIADPGGTDQLTYLLTAAGSGGGADATQTIVITRGGTVTQRPAVWTRQSLTTGDWE